MRRTSKGKESPHVKVAAITTAINTMFNDTKDWNATLSPTQTTAFIDALYDVVDKAPTKSQSKLQQDAMVMLNGANWDGHDKNVIAKDLSIRAQSSYQYGYMKAQGYREWQWQTVNDDAVDDVCNDLDQEVFDISVQFRPAHLNCRCSPKPYGDPDTTTWMEDDLQLFDSIEDVDIDLLFGYGNTALLDSKDFDKIHKAVMDKLDSPQVDALSSYQGGGYNNMNSVSRGKDSDMSDYNKAAAAGQVKALTGAIDQYGITLPVDTIAWRGISGNTGKSFADANVGFSVTDGGFTSVSGNQVTAGYFAADTRGRDSIVLTVVIPKGTKFIPGVPSEQELIFPPNMKLTLITTPVPMDKKWDGRIVYQAWAVASYESNTKKKAKNSKQVVKPTFAKNDVSRYVVDQSNLIMEIPPE